MAKRKQFDGQKRRDASDTQLSQNPKIQTFHTQYPFDPPTTFFT